MRDLAPDVRIQFDWPGSGSCEEVSIPTVDVARSYRPGGQRVPQPCISATVVESDRLHAAVLPKRGCGTALARLKCEQSPLAASPKIEGFEKILYRRVVSPVADEYNLESRQQSLDETGRPSVRQIGATEISAGDDKLVVIGTLMIAIHTTM